MEYRIPVFRNSLPAFSVFLFYFSWFSLNLISFISLKCKDLKCHQTRHNKKFLQHPFCIDAIPLANFPFILLENVFYSLIHQSCKSTSWYYVCLFHKKISKLNIEALNLRMISMQKWTFLIVRQAWRVWCHFKAFTSD